MPLFSPPFRSEFSLLEEEDLTFPPAFWAGSDLISLSPRPPPPSGPARSPKSEISSTPLHLSAFLGADLHPSKLNQLHSVLWFAGLPSAPRPLHRQRHVLNRALCPTERPNEHLVWHEGRLFLKPLPGYLLCHAFWLQHLCADQELHASACGMLLSWAWLVLHESDLRVAREAGLLPGALEASRGAGGYYRAWAALMGEVLATLEQSHPAAIQVNRRYVYGELRLSRLDKLVRLSALSAPWSRARRLVEGYAAFSSWRGAFFQRSFGWMLAVFAVFSVLLSALQVGLSVEDLAANPGFQQLSGGVALFSAAAVFLAVLFVLVAWGFLAVYHFVSTRRYVKKMLRTHGTVAVAGA